MSTNFYDVVTYAILKTRIDRKMKINDILEDGDINLVLVEAKKLFQYEPTLLELQGEFVVVGDIHGNIDDLIRIFERCGYPPESKYLFLGDYVDRGAFGIEVVTLLFVLKAKYPEHIYMIRGNHETPSINHNYGFYSEVCSKYNKKLYESINKVFGFLPMAAVLNGSIFCVHGGLSPKLKSLEDIVHTSKSPEIFGPGLLSDLVWSDPSGQIGGFTPSARGSGCYYGSEAISDFCNENNLKLIIRSHELCSRGIEWPIKESEFILTIFSNTDYCNKHNSSAVLRIKEDASFTPISFDPLSSHDKKHRKVIFPSWICDFLSKAEIDISEDEEDDIPSSPDWQVIDDFENQIHAKKVRYLSAF